MNAMVSDRTHAERERRYRRRQSKGALFAMVDIPASLGAVLIECGYLTEQDALAAPRKRGEALMAYIHGLRKSTTPSR